MDKRVNKLFWVWQSDKEKAFLEEMSLQGYRLVRVGFGTYDFRKSDPQKRIYQFDFKGLNKMPEEEYLQLYEDSGWDLDGKFGGWYYFSKEVGEDVDPSIFNDITSKKSKYRRLLLYLFIIGIPIINQIFITIPGMSDSKLAFPSFYFFFRIFIYIIGVLYLASVIKIISMYRKLNDHMRE